MINASTVGNAATLTWPSKTFAGSYLIFKRNSLTNNDWGTQIATLGSTSTSYTDNSLPEGTAAEYRVIAVNSSNQAQSFGYIHVGNKLKAVLKKGGILLMIDSTFITSLSTEIGQLSNDLTMEGWDVDLFYIGRTKPPLRQRIS